VKVIGVLPKDADPRAWRIGYDSGFRTDNFPRELQPSDRHYGISKRWYSISHRCRVEYANSDGHWSSGIDWISDKLVVSALFDYAHYGEYYPGPQGPKILEMESWRGGGGQASFKVRGSSKLPPDLENMIALVLPQRTKNLIVLAKEILGEREVRTLLFNGGTKTADGAFW